MHKRCIGMDRKQTVELKMLKEPTARRSNKRKNSNGREDIFKGISPWNVFQRTAMNLPLRTEGVRALCSEIEITTRAHVLV